MIKKLKNTLTKVSYNQTNKCIDEDNKKLLERY